MTLIASRDLRNHTREVLRRVADGDVVTITVNGMPVADIRPHARARPTALSKADFVALQRNQVPDSTLTSDMAWISEGETDEFDPL